MKTVIRRTHQPRLGASLWRTRSVASGIGSVAGTVVGIPWLPLRYGLAVAAVGLAWITGEMLVPLAGDRDPFLVFGLAVLISAFAGGLGPGILALALSSVVAVYFYLPPRLALGVPEPFDVVRLSVFVLEGLVAAIAGGVLRRAIARSETVDQSTRRLAGFLQRAESVRRRPLLHTETLIEGLTEREREVARLLAFGLANGEIAATLFVSRNTVKTHLKHIYEKLAVRTRTEAVARCIELGLLKGEPGEDEARAATEAAAIDLWSTQQRPAA